MTTSTTSPTTIILTPEQHVGHADHWHILTPEVESNVPMWLQGMIDNAVMIKGLDAQPASTQKQNDTHLLIGENQPIHIKQVLSVVEGKPQSLLNAYPCVDSPYGLTGKIERLIVSDDGADAVLRLSCEGTVIYAYDQLYAVNQGLYQKDTDYYVNLSAWAYNFTSSSQDEVVLIEDQKAIRYHRAFNDIVAANDGKVPDDIDQRIAEWQPETDAPLAPVEINMGNMCAYLFGNTLGQEDEAWCQGQVLGKQNVQFNEIAFVLFDVVILREPDSTPMVVRIATPADEETNKIAVEDYIQANIWLQAAIYADNQPGKGQTK